ncbi:MAG: pyruvate dehydrogenase complex dihydrolipoamide acetyltransferase, partial [Alphaproteobacteria bacterium]|nr:pyruvate dehydrogenase complex dihydrolipoamide acetyltransferase [Alphaproteobacteria bacterium]
LSPTMTEGNLAKWHKKEGDAVKSGDVIAEIETDKATMEVEAVDEGIIEKILIAAGTEKVAVNTPIALLRGEGEAAGAAPKPVAAPAPAPIPAPKAQAVAPVPAPAAPAAPQGQRIFASPLAKRLAQQAGLDLKAIAGSGPHGRIVKSDVEKAASSGTAKAAPTATPAPKQTAPMAAPAPVPIAGFPPFDLLPLDNMRRVIARRLTEAKQTIPHFYLGIDCVLDAALDIRKQLNAKDEKLKLSVNDFVVRAAALALRKVPTANAAWTEDGIRLYKSADVSVAVAIDGGLITPIIRAAETKGLAQISAEMKDLAARAKARKLKPEEFQGGTFSVSNLGMFGIKSFTAVINPPQGAILAVGAGETRPIVRNGALAIATVMTVNLSCDHRVVDGAVGAEFLAAFKALIEDPLTMLL